MSGELNWGNIKSSGNGDTNFLKLKLGTTQVRVVGLPHEVEIHWEKGLDGSNKRVVCPGAGCPICKSGKVPQKRFQVWTIDREDGKCKILEGGTKIFSAIKDYAMDPDYGDPTQYDIKIKKEGSGRETKYTVLASPKKFGLDNDEQSMVNEQKTLSEINKPKSIDEILAMGLECLADSVDDLNNWNDDLQKQKNNEISNDDWSEL